MNIEKCFGRTALMIAIENGFRQKTQILLQGKAFVNMHDKYGETALILAGKSFRSSNGEGLRYG